MTDPDCLAHQARRTLATTSGGVLHVAGIGPTTYDGILVYEQGGRPRFLCEPAEPFAVDRPHLAAGRARGGGTVPAQPPRRRPGRSARGHRLGARRRPAGRRRRAGRSAASTSRSPRTSGPPEAGSRCPSSATCPRHRTRSSMPRAGSSRMSTTPTPTGCGARPRRGRGNRSADILATAGAATPMTTACRSPGSTNPAGTRFDCGSAARCAHRSI